MMLTGGLSSTLRMNATCVNLKKKKISIWIICVYDELLKLMDSYIMEGKHVRYLCCRLKSAWDEPTELL